MTMTESPPAEAAEAEPKAAAELAAEGLYAWLSTSDHKVIGRIWIRLSLLLLVAATAVGAAVAFEQVDGTDTDIFGGLNGYFQMWGLYRFGMVLLVLAPLFIGLATVIVPMQVGSSNIAFPRAALAAAWGYVFGAIVTVVSVLAGGGWGALDGVTGDEADAIELTLLGTGIVIVSILLASVCLATTVISLRTPGMGLAKVPLFAWSMLVTASVWLLTLPVLVANLVIVTVDLRGGPLLFGNPEGSDQIYSQLAWLFEQPQIYSMAIPVLGVIGSVAPVVNKGRHLSHAAGMVLIGLAGLLSVGGWSQPFFGDERDSSSSSPLPSWPLSGARSCPALARHDGEGRRPWHPPAPLAGAFGAAGVLLLATVAGTVRVVLPLLDDSIPMIGTTADTAVLNLVVFAALSGGVAGLWFWAPKIGGRSLSNLSGLGVITMLLGGGVLLGAGALLAGFDDTPDNAVGSFDSLTETGMTIAAIGSVLAVLGALGVLAALATALRNDADADGDPWGGHTLEWATATPADNFSGPLARVMSEAPLLDEPADEEEES